MRIPFLLAIITLLLSIVVDVCISRELRQIAKNKVWFRIQSVTSPIFWILFLIMYFLPKRSESSGILTVMWMIYGYVSIYSGKLTFLLISSIVLGAKKLFRIKSTKNHALFTGAATGIAVLSIMISGALYTRHHIEVKHIEISIPSIPENFIGFKIAQVSDLHVGTWGNDTTFISKLVESVNRLDADLIVFTGDLVNRKSSELIPFVNILSRMKAKYGVMSVLGNHDYGDYVDWKSSLERDANNALLHNLELEMGWDLLNNDRRIISIGKDSLMIVGVENWGEPPFPEYGRLEKALSSSPDSVFNQNDGRFKILLSHNPEHWNRYVSKNTDIDLTLSGHTHAMQTMVEICKFRWSPAKFRYPQWGGLYETINNDEKKTKLYVNIGVGEVGLPVRLISAYPEITLFTFTK